MSHTLALGLYDPECPPRFASAGDWEKLLGAPVRVLSWYQAWGARYADCKGEMVTRSHHHRLTPLITWEPWRLPADLPPGTPLWDQPEFALANIASGVYDGYVRSWALTLAAAGHPVYLRPFHEMNGNWYPWGGAVNGNHPRTFRRAWRHLRRLFREEGADNVAFVWCPYAHSVPEGPENALEQYFPGAEEVDWLALDGYNWGTTQSWSEWQSFVQVFEPAYRRLLQLAPGKPMMIAEVGCAEQGGDKGAWIREALTALASRLSRVQVLVWFNVDKECDWRLTSSPAALQAFREEAWRFTAGGKGLPAASHIQEAKGRQPQAQEG